jgi:CubicO group peptidase (beta-lactamase class C family)
MRTIRVLASVVCSTSLTACEAPTVPAPLADSGASYFPAATWRTADPVSAGFDRRAIDALRRDIDRGTYGSVDGVAVVRFGHVVLEHYNGWSPGQRHTMQSVTKSVTSLLFGIAASQHPSAATLDRPVLELFTQYPAIANLDDHKRALTLRHLLSMRTGMNFYEQPYAGSPLEELNRSTGDWVKYVLDRPMLEAPGQHWAYNSGAAIVMCGVIRELAGEPVNVFARRELFERIGVTSALWYVSAFDALPHCGGGLQLTLIDLARIGYLVLRGGAWSGTQVVPSDWLTASVQPYSTGASVFFSNSGASYGYYWWLFPDPGGSSTGVIAGSGNGGQWLFVVPSKDLVVAVIASSGDGLGILYDGVLASIR